MRGILGTPGPPLFSSAFPVKAQATSTLSWQPSQSHQPELLRRKEGGQAPHNTCGGPGFFLLVMRLPILFCLLRLPPPMLPFLPLGCLVSPALSQSTSKPRKHLKCIHSFRAASRPSEFVVFTLVATEPPECFLNADSSAPPHPGWRILRLNLQ